MGCLRIFLCNSVQEPDSRANITGIRLHPIPRLYNAIMAI
jgi:hypothetical protein